LETKTETKRKKEGMEFLNKIILSDCLTGIKQMPDSSVDCCISSPPYWGLRDYGVDGQVGNEQDFKEFVKKLIELYSEIQRVLKPTGTCFVNLGDTYNGTKQGNTETNKNPKLVTDSFKKERIKDIQDKSLLMIPERFAIGMIDEGWILRNQIIWHKPNQMPQSATDRFTVDFEKIFFFVKQSTGYYFEQQLEPYTKPLDRWGGDDLEANGKSTWDNGTGQTTYRNRNMRPNPDGKNMRTVWSINTEPFPEAHFATYPEKLVKRMIEAGCPENGLVLDPFMGAGTTAVVAKKLNRNYTGFELNPKYKLIAENRLIKEVGLFL
jgi:DNA modification methylase